MVNHTFVVKKGKETINVTNADKMVCIYHKKGYNKRSAV